MHIKMNDLKITNIEKNGYKAVEENVYAQAKRANSLKMIKILLGQIYTISVTLINVTSTQMRQIQMTGLLPEINVEFYDENSGSYITQNMYCKTINKIATLEIPEGFIYDKITLEFVGNEKIKR